MNTYNIPKNKSTQKVVERIGEEYYTEKPDGTFDVHYSDQHELYDLGYDVAKETFKEKPEEFVLPTEYVSVLKEAISQYQQDSGIRVTTFHFKELGEKITQIAVEPTQGHILFAIYTRYGKLIRVIN
jgi:hypothetical protein